MNFKSYIILSCVSGISCGFFVHPFIVAFIANLVIVGLLSMVHFFSAKD